MAAVTNKRRGKQTICTLVRTLGALMTIKTLHLEFDQVLSMIETKSQSLRWEDGFAWEWITVGSGRERGGAGRAGGSHNARDIRLGSGDSWRRCGTGRLSFAGGERRDAEGTQYADHAGEQQQRGEAAHRTTAKSSRATTRKRWPTSGLMAWSNSKRRDVSGRARASTPSI